MHEPLIQIKRLRKEFRIQGKKLLALQDISFTLNKGETLGLVGESGCGKSTTGRCLLRLEEATSGHVFYESKDLLTLTKKELFAFRRSAAIIFQDPYSSLNPRMRVRDIIAEPLRIHRAMEESAIGRYLEELVDKVALSRSSLERFPHEFSGGQRQRIGIARAIALKPHFLVCDEPISALDVSIQAQIVNLLKDLQKELSLTILFIAHDLAMVKYISDRVAVMYLGNIVEIAAPAEALYRNPKHPYTEALLSAIPSRDPERAKAPSLTPPLKGEIPSALTPPKGCPFASRCPRAMPKCHVTPPTLQEVAPGHFAACHLHD